MQRLRYKITLILQLNKITTTQFKFRNVKLLQYDMTSGVYFANN